jgi:hypothetical protein
MIIRTDITMIVTTVTIMTAIVIMITEVINKTVFGLSDWFRGFDWIGAFFLT